MHENMEICIYKMNSNNKAFIWTNKIIYKTDKSSITKFKEINIKIPKWEHKYGQAEFPPRT